MFMAWSALIFAKRLTGYSMLLNKLFFDKEDRELLRMVNNTLDTGHVEELEHRVFDDNLHPHGILELTTSHEFRVAYAVINLLGSLEAGQVEDRLHALRALRDEVLHSARTTFRYNTGRVLIQIMKEIVRSRHDEYKQLRLAHDFRKAASGNPRVVRRYLCKHHLLEMPEEWDQLTMDHHVHDANTKGRKNPTHLIMDAWVKGIRFLTVVYYNYIEHSAARELLKAAEIMGISVRIGIEFCSPFRGKVVNFVWAPRGFSDTEAVLAFLGEQPMVRLMQEGRNASRWMERHVLDTLDHWNTVHRPALATELGIDLQTLEPQAFLTFVGMGQPSHLHLAEYIHKIMQPLLVRRVGELSERLIEPDFRPDERAAAELLIRRMDALTSEVILETWIKPERNPQLPSPYAVEGREDAPALLRLPPHALLDWLSNLRSGYRVTLQLADLTPEDVLELLWDCQGMITHLELFNLKEWQEGHLVNLRAINDLQRAINEGSALHLKQAIRAMIRELEASTVDEDAERCEKFRIILRNIPTLQEPYKIAPLSERIGTDSTSHSSIRHGMGLVVFETLPPRARRALVGKHFNPIRLPVHLDLVRRESFTQPPKAPGFLNPFVHALRGLPGCSKLGLAKSKEWLSTTARICRPEHSNVFTMGGIGGTLDNGLRNAQHEQAQPRPRWPGMGYLNTAMSNTLKVLAGFIPAMIAFQHTQSWWMLAWFGAVIWFAITGLRNIAQAVLGGGGLRQSSLLRWNNYVNWTRICDSLMYTGWSVVLLEWGIRSGLLEYGLGLTVSNQPFLVFTIIAAANGLYIASHNIFRGLPTEAVIGNLFRSVLAIPISVVYYDLLFELLRYFGMTNPLIWLQPGAAIISKASSDTVAGLIEGFADKRNNRRLRIWDYKTKLAHLFDCYTQVELAFPDRDILYLLARPQELIRLLGSEASEQQRAFIVNALDLMYFWYYQPYAQQALISMIRTLTREERVILARSQHVLVRVREVSQLFVDGLLGWNFARALSFYLDRHDDYIRTINKVCANPDK